MPELEALLRDARPDWPEPSAAAGARARAALGFAPSPRSPRGWLTRTARARGTRLLIPAALLLTAGAAVAATLISTGSSGAPAGRPAALDFGPPDAVGGPVSLIDGLPAVAVDGRGVVTVAWGRAGRIVVSSRVPGGGWSAPERVSDPARRAAYPRVGTDRDGDVTVVWRERIAATRVTQRFTLPSGAPAGYLTELTGQRWAVVARTRPADGSWSPARRLSDETASVRDMEAPGLVVMPDGRTVVTWDVAGSMWSRGRAPGGDWSPAERVGGDRGEAVDPQLAGAPSGGAVLTWSNRIETGTGRRYAIRAAVQDADGTWGDAEVIDDAAVNPPHAAPALGRGGDAAVAWISESMDRTETSASVRPAGGDWSAAALVDATPRLFGLRGAPAIGGDGRAVVLSGPRGAAAVRGDDGVWRPLPLSPVAGRAFGLAAFADGAGGVVVVRGAAEPSRLVVERAGGAGDPVRRATSASSTAPVAAAGPDGTTALAWARSGPSTAAVVAVAEPPR
ncbi:MAG: hypothetical protein AB7O78_06905 [Thermoleophilia bacterium]